MLSSLVKISKVLPSSLLLLGKILEDSKTLEECKVEEKNFVVVMVTKVS